MDKTRVAEMVDPHTPNGYHYTVINVTVVGRGPVTTILVFPHKTQ